MFIWSIVLLNSRCFLVLYPCLSLLPVTFALVCLHWPSFPSGIIKISSYLILISVSNIVSVMITHTPPAGFVPTVTRYTVDFKIKFVVSKRSTTVFGVSELPVDPPVMRIRLCFIQCCRWDSCFSSAIVLLLLQYCMIDCSCWFVNSLKYLFDSFRLKFCGLTEERCGVLASFLSSKTSHLTVLDASNNDLQDSGVKQLAAALGSLGCRLKSLRLQLLKPNKNKNLNLSNCTCSSAHQDRYRGCLVMQWRSCELQYPQDFVLSFLCLLSASGWIFMMSDL